MRETGFQRYSVEHDMPRALKQAEMLAGPEGLVCVCGSFYLAGDARKQLAQAEHTTHRRSASAKS